jgi:opacity protein-like surface antigen
MGQRFPLDAGAGCEGQKPMKLTKIALIIAAASFTAGPALAQEPIGEPSYLGMKRGRYVPAPAPVPETFNWYLRVDLGVGWSSFGGNESGFEHGLGTGAGFARDVTIFSDANWYEAGKDPFFQGGIGFGKYFSPRFRMDMTLDVKTADTVNGYETGTYEEHTRPILNGGVPTGFDIDWTLRDRVDVTDGIGLINAYLDLVPRGRFTPYIGIGAGFAARYIDRTHSTVEERIDGGGNVIGMRSWSDSHNETKIAPAISGTVGFAWAITRGTILDLNYRYTYVGAVDSTMTVTPPGSTPQRSKITIDESHQHSLRAGLRWNIW